MMKIWVACGVHEDECLDPCEWATLVATGTTEEKAKEALQEVFRGYAREMVAEEEFEHDDPELEGAISSIVDECRFTYAIETTVKE